MIQYYFLSANAGLLQGFLFTLIVILVLLTILGIFYLYFTTRTKERLALIEKGMDPNLANSDLLTRVAIIAGGFAVGLILADALPGKFGPLVGFLCAGVAIVIYSVYKRNSMKKGFMHKNDAVKDNDLTGRV